MKPFKITVLLGILLSFSSVNAQSTLTFTGTGNTGTWSPYEPSSTTGLDNVVIEGTKAILRSGWVMNNLTLKPGSSISMNNQTVTVNGDLVIEDGANFRIRGNGSVDVAGTSSIDIVGTNTDARYNVWSSPFPDAEIGLWSIFSGVNPCDLYVWNASTQEWKYDYLENTSTTCVGNPVTFSAAFLMEDGTADGNFDLGRGYFVPGEAIATRTISSTSGFNNGDLSTIIYGNSTPNSDGVGWNLIGNPYPSTLRVKQLVEENSTLFNAVYLYRANGNFTTKSATSNYDISPCQGFYVEASSLGTGASASVSFNNSMRKNSGYTFLKTDSVMVPSEVFISVNSPQSENDQIQIIISDEAKREYDRKYDARKLWNASGPGIATLLEADAAIGEEPFVINGISSVAVNTAETLPLLVYTNQTGIYEIALDSVINASPGLIFTLEDRNKRLLVDLSTSSYSFVNANVDTLENRFFLHISNKGGPNSVNNIEQENIISIYHANGYLYVTELSQKANIEEVQVFDMIGKLKFRKTVGSTNSFEINTSNFETGVYIVKSVNSLGQTYSQRVFIK